MVIVNGPVMGCWLRLLPCSWPSIGSHSIEYHRLTVVADAGLTNFTALLLQFQIENGPLAALMPPRLGKNA